MPDPANGATVLWDAGSASDFSWDTATNWSGDALPTSGDDLTFPKPAPNPGSLPSDPSIVTLGTGESANSLSFFDKYTLTGGDLTLTSGNGGVILVTIGNTTTIASKLTGNAGLTKINDGALILTNAANDYTGTTQIDSGSVIITDPGALGADGSAVIVTGNTTRGSGGGLLVIGSQNNNLTGLTFTRDLALTGGGPTGDGTALNSVGNNIFSGNIVTGGNPAGLSPVSGIPITATGTTLASTYGTATLNGGLTLTPSGQTTTFSGNGNWIINSDINGPGNLQKTGNGLLVLTGNNTFTGTLTAAGGYLRIYSAAALGTSTSNGALTLNAGKVEFRSDTPNFTTATKVTFGTSTTTDNFYLDRALGGTGLNQTINLGLVTLSASTNTRTIAVNSRNGYGLTFTGNMATGSQGSVTITNNGNGLLTFSGNLYNTTNTTARTLTISGAGDTMITGNILASGAAHILTKAGNGTLTINGTGSTYTGATNIQAGTLAINDFRAVANNASAINIGNTTTAATLSVIGNNLLIANLTTAKVINLSGTTGGATILANQTGTSPGLVFSADFTATGSGIKTLTLGGANALDNTIGGAIVNNSVTNTTALTKVDSGTWVLAGSSSYTGSTTIAGGTLKLKANAASSTILADTSAIIFNVDGQQNAGGTLEFVGQDGVNNVENLGALTPTAGAGTIKLTHGLGGTASVVFSSLGAISGTAGLNFIGSDASNTVTVTGAPASLIAANIYFNGADFAYSNAGVLRAPDYTSDADFATSASVLSSAKSNEITGSFGSAAVTIDSLKINGSQTLTMTGLLTVRTAGASNATGGVLQTGGAGSIDGTGITTGGSGALVIRVDGALDTLTLNAPVTSTTTGGLTKNGAGTLVIAGLNAQTGATTINEGTIMLSGSGRLSGASTSTSLAIRDGAFLDLNGVSTGTAIDDFNGGGTVTNSNAAAAVFQVGNNNGTGTFSGVIKDGAGQISVTKLGTGAQTWSGTNTYSGVTTIGSTGIVTVTSLANIGTASGIGTGDETITASNAASLVFTGASSSQAFGGLSYAGSDSISIDRLFTFGGTAANSGARIQANGVNNATLIFNNSNALAFGTPNIDQGLVLGGASTGDNQFNPQITDNGTGIVSVYKADAGVWVLGNPNNTYSGVTSLMRGTLRAVDGASLPASSALLFNATGTNTAVLESTGDFTRGLGTGAGQVSWSTAANGGFAAAESKLTVNIGGNATPDTLTWGVGGFVTTNLVLSSTTALSEVEILNGINLNGAARTIQVDINSTSSSDFATLSGVVSGALGSGLIKTGSGILSLVADNTYSGDTNINAGTVRVVNIGNSTSSFSNLGDGTGKVTLGTGTTAATLAYVGGGETTNREIDLAGSTANTIIEASGTGALILTNVVNTGTGAKTLSLRGDLNAANEITSILANNGANVLSVTKDDNGTWILSGQNTFTGTMTVSAGAFGLASDSNGPVGGVTSSNVGVTRLTISNGSVFALNGDRTLNTLVRLNANASSNFIGINSITLNSIETTTGGNTTVTNSLPAGKFLTLNSPTFTGTENTGTNRTFVFNGSGDTILNASVTDSLNGGIIALTYQGYGSLTLGGSNGASTYSGATTITSGTFKLGSADAIPNGAGKGNVVMNPGIGLTAALDLNGFNQTINGLTANSVGTANIDNSSTSAATFTFGATDQAVTLIGSITNTGAGALSVAKIGSAAASFSGGTYAQKGATSVSGGSLTLAGDVTSTTSLSVTGGSTLAITGGFSGSTGVNSLEVGGGSTLALSLNNAGTPLSNLNTLNLGNTGSGTVTLKLNIGDLNTAGDGLNSDTITLLTGGTLNLGNTVTFNMSDAGMNPGQTYTLLHVVDGGLTAFGLGNLIQGLTPGGFDSYTWITNDNFVQLQVGALVTGVQYWRGATDTTWNGALNNWSTDKAGTTPAVTLPGAGTDVIFQWDAPSNAAVNTTLEQSFKINSLTFEGATNPANTPSSITIASGADPAFRLQVAPQVATDGVKITADGPASVTISAPFKLGADQTWTVANPAATLVFSGAIQGEQDVTVSGVGRIVLGAAADATFNPGLTSDFTITGGNLELQNVGALGTTIAGNAANVIVIGGAFYYNNATSGTINNPLTLGGGTLSAGGATQTYNGAVNISADSFINMRDSNSATVTTTARNITLSGVLSGPGRLSVDSVSTLSGGNQFTGTLTLSNDNSGWSGGLNLTRGTVTLTNVHGLGTGNVTGSAGRIIFNTAGGTTFDLGQNFTVDGPGGILELSADASGTPVTDLTVNLSGVITIGSAGNANNALRISQSSDNFSIINISNSIVLGNNASLTYQGSSVRPLDITAIISDGGSGYNLAVNDELYGWGVTSRTVRLSGANTFSGDISITEGALEFSTVSNIGGPASNLGQGSAISVAIATLRFIGSTSQSTDRTLTVTGGTGSTTTGSASTLSAEGTGGAIITYNGAITAAGNYLILAGNNTSSGVLTGGITMTGTAADLYVNSGTWTLSGATNTFADDVIVTGSNTGTAVLNLNSTGVLSYNSSTSNGLYARDGGVINLNANDVNGAGNSGGLDFIILGDSPTGAIATLNTNTFNITTPRLDVGGIISGRVAQVLGTGTVTVTYTGTDYGQGIRLFEGSIAANLAGVATILKQGLDDFTLSGDNTGLIGTVAATRVDSGNLILDFTTDNHNKISSSVALDLRGGTVTVNGSSTADTVQNVSGLTLGNGGTSQLVVISGGGHSATLNLGAITRSNGSQDGTLRLILPDSGAITTTTANGSHGLLGSSGFATIKDATGTYFATNDGSGNIIPLTYASSKNDVSTWLKGDHITDSGGGFTGTLECANINSLRFDAPGGSAIIIIPTGVLSIASGGILMTDAVTSGPSAIQGGTLASATSELIFTQDSVQALSVSSDIRINHAVTKAGSGTLILSGNNTYTDETEIQSGILVISGGHAIGDSSLVTLADDHASKLQLLDDETIGRLAGGSATTGLDQLAVVDVGSHTLTINQTSTSTGSYAGLLVGGGAIVKNGPGQEQFTNVSTAFTGTVTINNGLLYLTGLGTINASAITVNKGGTFLIDNNGTTRSGTRILDTTPVTLNSADGAFSGTTIARGFAIRTDQNATTSETIGALNFNSGANYLSGEASGTTGIAYIIADNFTRANNATVDARARNMGGTTLDRNQFKIGTAANENAFLLTLVGGGGAANSATRSIVPWAIGEKITAALADTNMGNSLLTYVAGQGLVALDLTTEYSTYAGVGSSNNVRESLTSDLTGLTGRTLNALVINNNNTTASTVNVSGSGAGQTLTNNSGAFLFTLNTAAAAASENGINLSGFDDGITVGATGEYIFFVVNPSSAATTANLTVTINSPLTSAADITKSGRGTLVLTGLNSAGGGANFTTLNEGILEISALGNIGGSTGGLVFAGGTLRLSSTYAGDDLSTRMISFLAGGGTLDTNGNDISLAGPLGTGIGGFTKTGLGTLTLNAAATYTGGNNILGGTVVLGTSNAIGSGDLLVGGGATLDLGTNSISAGLVTTTGASPNILGTGTITSSSGFVFSHTGDTMIDAILAGPVGLLKQQTNILTLTGANTFTGPVEIQAGTVVFSSITDIGGGPSALGNPDSVRNGVIHVGLTSAATTLSYNGSGSSSDRIIALQGTTGSVTLGADGTGAIALGGVMMETTGNKTLTLQGSSDPLLNNTLGVIDECGLGVITLLKTESATWVLNGVNNYSGATNINEGILRYTADQILPGALNFGNSNTVATAGTLDLDTADASFGSLLVQTNSTSNTNHLIIGAGHTLTITGSATIGGSGANSTTLLDTSGGGDLVIANPAASGLFSVGGSVSTGNKAVADFRGLNSLIVNLDPTTGIVRINPNSSTNVSDKYSTLYLPATGVGNTTITANQLDVGDGGQNNGSTGQINALYLGSGANIFNVNLVNVGTGIRDIGNISFGAAAGTIKIRAADGTGAATFNMGTGTATTGVSGAQGNTFDVTGHDADLLLGAVNIGTQNRNSPLSNEFSFDQGTLNMTSLVMSTKSSNGSTTTSTMNLGGGVVNIGSGSGTAVTLATNSGPGTANATINITGGVVTITGDVVKGANTGAGASTGAVNLDGGSLDLSGNAIGSAGNLIAFTAASGTLQNLGELNGGAVLTKTTAGTLVMQGVNSYTGGTAINGGILQVNSAAALGNSGTITFGGGTLQYTANNQTDYSARFGTDPSEAYSIDTNGRNVAFATALTSAGGSLAKSGAGNLRLTVANSYDAGTTVIAGALLANNSGGSATGSGPVNVTGGALGGTGSVAGVTVVNGTGTVRPGDPTITNGIGTFTANNDVTLSGAGTPASRLELELGLSTDTVFNDSANIAAHQEANDLAAYLTDSGTIALYEAESGTHDRLSINGTLNLDSGGQISLVSQGYVLKYGDVLDLLDWTAVNFNADASGASFSTADDLVLPDLSGSGLSFDRSLFSTQGIVVVVPEPTRAITALLGLAAVLMRRRRHRAL